MLTVRITLVVSCDGLQRRKQLDNFSRYFKKVTLPGRLFALGQDTFLRSSNPRESQTASSDAVERLRLRLLKRERIA